MTDDKDDSKSKQKTQPKGTDKEGVPYEPIEIPIPKKKDVFRFLKKSAKSVEKSKD
jgi:hypothetical protein